MRAFLRPVSTRRRDEAELVWRGRIQRAENRRMARVDFFEAHPAPYMKAGADRKVSSVKVMRRWCEKWRSFIVSNRVRSRTVKRLTDIYLN
ncbi:hypothetical protein [Paludibacterium paludis]|uniref:hypothetical protein n=1 Tax=Paludibacterium paludis TaxID=1225769 RepID=UPI001674ECA2|nr:hypothetical protein [Paludibacterium paludis]